MKNSFPTLLSKYITISILIISSCTSAPDKQIRSLSNEKISIQDLDTFIINQMDSLNVAGISIAMINEAKVVYHRTFGLANIQDSIKVDSNTIFEAASISKPFFTYFVMKMVDKEVIDLDTPLYSYLPYPDIENDERYKLITARMVLNHSTGFPNWRFFYPENKLFIQFTPGTDFYYSGEGYLYLTKVIAHLTGVERENLDSLIQEEVCIPLGIIHTYFSGNDYISKHKAIGYIDGKITDDVWDRTAFNSAASLHSEAREYSKFLIAVMNETGLNSGTVQQMLKEQIIIPDDDELKSDGYYSWALGFGIKKIANKLYYGHGGNNWKFQSHFLFDKDRKNGYVFFTNCNNGSEFNKKLEKFLTE